MQPRHFLVYSKKLGNNCSLIESIKEKLISNAFVYDEKNPTLIIVLGGDGSFLRAIHDPLLPRGKNILYVLLNTGHLGFYADYQKEETDLFVSDLIKKEPEIESLPFYCFTIDGEEHHCINDVSIQSGETVFMNVFVNEELLVESRCNGIVIATPAGSSGFLSSLESPLVVNSPNVYQFSLLAACRNRLYSNPITKAILCGNDELKVQIADNPMMEIYIDGGHKTDFTGREFTFSHKNDDSISLLHFRKLSYVKRLRKNISGKE